MKNFYALLGQTTHETKISVQKYGGSFGKVAIGLFILNFLSISASAQNDFGSNNHMTSRKMAAAMKYSDGSSSKSSYVATSELEKEINSVLKDARVLLMDENIKARFETGFAPEMFRKVEQSCPSVDLKNLILGSDTFVASTIVSDQELKHALGLLKKSVDFLNTK